jgi:Uma2 family endonuclease
MLDPSLIAPDKPRRLKRSEFMELAERGVFEGERVELLYGVIVEMAPEAIQHASPIQDLSEFLILNLAGRATVRIQLSYACDDESQPKPDLAIVPRGKYRDDHPTSAHCIIEVAYSSVRKDRLVKAPLYAASRVQEYWIVNANDRSIEVFRDSDGSRYRSERTFGMGESVSLAAFPDVTVRVADLFDA